MSEWVDVHWYSIHIIGVRSTSSDVQGERAGAAASEQTRGPGGREK